MPLLIKKGFVKKDGKKNFCVAVDLPVRMSVGICYIVT